MPTFTFTNNNGFDVYFYSATQPGTLRGWGSVTERERTKTFVLDLPAGTELHFTTKMTMDLSSHGPAVYHDSGITFDAYRTTGADRQTHTIRDVSTSFYIRNSSTSPIFCSLSILAAETKSPPAAWLRTGTMRPSMLRAR